MDNEKVMMDPVVYVRQVLSSIRIKGGFIEDVWWERNQIFEASDNGVSGKIDVGFRLLGLSGGNWSFEVPVFVHDSEYLEPKIIFWNNQPLILASSTLNKFIESALFYEPVMSNWTDVEQTFFYVKQPINNKPLDRYSKLIRACILEDGQPFRDFFAGKECSIKGRVAEFRKTSQYYLEDAVFAAIEHSRLMKFYYRDVKGSNAGYRVVEPHYIWETKSGGRLLIAWDKTKDNWRSFYLDATDDVRIKIRNKFVPYEQYFIDITMYRMMKKEIPYSEEDFFEPHGPRHPRSIRKTRGSQSVSINWEVAA